MNQYLNFSLEGKVALVTGASYGIGFAIASAFAEQGATICFNDINQELVDKGAEEYIDILPGPSIDRNKTMWFHDPDGNKIEVHEFGPTAMQKVGREVPKGAEKEFEEWIS